MVNLPTANKPLSIMLADDDLDDRFFFETALSKLSISTKLATIDDGERLISYFSQNSDKLPDILFLDLNMPRKNGYECLKEIKSNKKILSLPIVIYSTSLHEDVADELYNNGADYYMRKTSLIELKKGLHHVLTMIVEKKFTRPERNKFVLRLAE